MLVGQALGALLRFIQAETVMPHGGSRRIEPPLGSASASVDAA
jgi:hypothetical protein